MQTQTVMTAQGNPTSRLKSRHGALHALLKLHPSLNAAAFLYRGLVAHALTKLGELETSRRRPDCARMAEGAGPADTQVRRTISAALVQGLLFHFGNLSNRDYSISRIEALDLLAKKLVLIEGLHRASTAESRWPLGEEKKALQLAHWHVSIVLVYQVKELLQCLLERTLGRLFHPEPLMATCSLIAMSS